MSTKKILTIVFSILIIAAFAFAITWGVINWSKVKAGMSGNGLYTKDDVQNSYEDGYNTALSDKEEYDKLINSYRDTIATQNDLISQYAGEATMLNNSIKEYQGQIASLNEQKSVIEQQVETLNTIKSNNEETIADLNGQIVTLSNQVLVVQANKDENENQIKALNGQITNLQNLNSQLQSTNELNIQTINGLNAQIVSLNNQISELNLQMINNSSTVNSLNVKIAELQKSVSYYEQYIATLESGEQVVATFEFDGSVYNIQIVNKNSTLFVATPTSTAYVIFNGWTVNGEPIDLATFRITTNTRIVADITYKYEVNFMSDGANYNSQIVLKGEVADMPTQPSKNGYVFDGWTIDGNSVVDVANYKITQNTTFTAKFTRLYSVVFKYEESTLKTDTIKSGQYATEPMVNSTAYKVFNGWRVNGVLVEVDNYRITADTVFVADITYKYDVKFMANDKIHATQIVEKNSTPSVPSNPTKAEYVFIGWSIDGTTAIDVSKYVISESTTFTALWKLDDFTVTFKVDNATYDTQKVANNGKPQYPTMPKKDGVAFYGWSVDGTNIVDESNYKITKATTLTAIFKEYGLINSEGRMTKTWEQLLSENYFKITEDNELTFGTNIGRTSLEGKLVIKPGVSDLSEYLAFSVGGVFEGCTKLTEIIIPDTVQNCYDRTFKGCTSLVNVVFPDSVLYLGFESFMDCSSLVMIKLPTYLTSINISLFENCTKLKSIDIPRTVWSIGERAFANCRAMKNIFIPDTVTSINAFEPTGSPFIGCSSFLNMYIERSDIPEEWGNFWAYVEEYGLTCGVFMTGCSYEDYLYYLEDSMWGGGGVS